MTSPPGSQNASPARIDSRRLAFEFEQHFAFEHVAERRAARVSVWRSARAARRVVDDNSHGMCAFGDERRLRFLHNRQCVLPCGVILLRHRSFLLGLCFRWRCRRRRRASVEPVMKLERGEARKSTACAISSGSAVRPNGNARPSSSLVFAPLRLDAFGFGGAGGDAVDPNSARAELGGPGAGKGFHCGFGGTVSGCTG